MPYAKFIAIAGFACLLAGCNDYLDNNDRMTPFSGEAQAANRAAQVVDPWPPHAADRNFKTNGERMQRAINNYKSGSTPTTSSPTSSSSNSGDSGSGESGSSSGSSTTGGSQN